jgi:hypothetical protein
MAESILRIPLTMNLTPSLGLKLHSAALDCHNSFVAKCGHFFNLSFEFFASVFGTVLTYFVVLLQLK